ncbi:hypothetical protein FB451DRAFT_1191541 [Mycena latifolia]|nr:hypothetical protein FB451DRAFT_1191541 [Mycena latifolia]
MYFNLYVTLSMAVATLAASISRGTFPPAHIDKVIDAAAYKATTNGTADLPGVGVINSAATYSHRLMSQIYSAVMRSKSAMPETYLCTAANWQQYCVYITDAGPGECVNLAGDLNDLVSSFGPDPNQQCWLYKDFDCSAPNGFGRIGPVSSPGIADLSQNINFGEGGIYPGFNDVLSSYQCYY